MSLDWGAKIKSDPALFGKTWFLIIKKVLYPFQKSKSTPTKPPFLVGQHLQSNGISTIREDEDMIGHWNSKNKYIKTHMQKQPH